MKKYLEAVFFQLKDLNKNFWINSSLEGKVQVPQLLNREYWQNSSTSISVCLSFKASNKFKLLTVQDLSSLYCASPIKRICVKWVCGFDLYFHPILNTPHSVFLTLMFHTIHFYDLHRPGAHFESIVVNFAQILPSCKGYISSYDQSQHHLLH